MKKIVITYGLIAGVVVAVLMWLTMPLGKEKMDYDLGEVLGYVSMIAALSMIFFGIKALRDKYLGGSITFAKGLVTGLLITLIAGVIYCVSWEIYYQNSGSDFMADYTTFYVEKMQEEGASAQEIEEMKTQMASMSEMYENPVIRFGITLMEILPVGVVITLICAAILRRQDVLPATE